MPGSPAATASIVDGDVIIAIDGIDTTGDNAEAAAWLLSVAPGTSVSITLARAATVVVTVPP